MHLLFFALIILVAVAILFQLDWIYYLVYVIGGVWLFSHWWVRRSLSRVEIQRNLVRHAFPGEIITARVDLANNNWLPIPWLHLQELVPFELQDLDNYRNVLSIGSRSRATYAYTLRCTKRGYYRLGPLKLDTGDLFGFVQAGWQETEPTHFIVYPRVVSIQELGLPSRSPFGTQVSRQRIFEDPARLSGVRDYVPGDTMRTVHWKASAHADTLLVKKFQPAIALNIVVVLDLNRNAYPLLHAMGSSEWAIVAAASVASHMIERRQPVGLLTNGLDPLANHVATPIPERNGRGHLMSILSLLARIQMHSFERTLAEWLPGKLASLEWGSTLVVVTPKLDEGALWALHQAYRRGSNVVVLVCAEDRDFKLMQVQGAKLGVKLYQIIWDRDLQGIE